MHKMSAWPNLRVKLTKWNIHQDKERRKFLKILTTEAVKTDESDYQICEEYREISKLYWTE